MIYDLWCAGVAATLILVVFGVILLKEASAQILPPPRRSHDRPILVRKPPYDWEDEDR